MAGSSGERTEKPTPKKVKDARERGHVSRSADLSGAVSLVGIALALGWLGAGMAAAAGNRLLAGLSSIGADARQDIDPGAVVLVMWGDAGLLARLVGPIALVAACGSVLASVTQVGWGYAPKALHLNWGRLAPAQGFRKLAPSYSGPELAKAVIGITAIGALCYTFLREFYMEAPRLVAMSPAESSAYGWDRVWSLLWRSSLALAVLGAADYGVQHWRWFSQQKMSRQDVRDESRLNDGNPEIKQRVRRIQRDMARKRMLHAVKTATVVVTNPTHFAVALEYRREEMSAPVVVAKGQDEVAARIRALAREHGVPIVENVTLARALHKTAEIGDVIPAPLFGAVAEVLAYLVRLKQLVL
jgi:flagellar biosynthetic protein FlhB